MDPSKIEKICREIALENSLKFGKANRGSVIKKVMAVYPDLRSLGKEISETASKIVLQLNSLSPKEHIELARKFYPHLLEDKERKKVVEKIMELPPLPEAILGKVITRLPPEPSGWPHIGHGYAGYVNWYYARKYDGKLILRFEDTNPKKVKEIFYEKFREGYRHLGIEWDQEVIESERLHLYYDCAEQLIESGDAYACSCEVETARKLRNEGVECSHRSSGVDKNLEKWEGMLTGDYNEGDIVFRLKGDLTSSNTSLRDPAIMRIVEEEHPLQGDKYLVWPLYDFAVSIEDSILGVTHVLRSEEFDQKTQLQNLLRERLGLRDPIIIHFSRVRIAGTPVAKRKIQKFLEAKIIHDWNDIRLSTIEAFKRRGIIPETIKELVMELQLTRGQPNIDWSIILAINRKLVDPIANRYFGVLDPIELEVVSALKPVTSKLRLHPDYPKRGKRTLESFGNFVISRLDITTSSSEDIIRLKDLYNIKLLEKTPSKIFAEFAGTKVVEGSPKIQWVPLESKIPLRVAVPDVLLIDDKINENSLIIKEGFVEKNILQGSEGDLIQLERIGFGLIEALSSNLIQINLNGPLGHTSV